MSTLDPSKSEHTAMLGALTLLAIASSLVLTAAALLQLPDALIGTSAVVFLASIVGAAWLAVLEGRHNGISTGRALAGGLWAGIRWLVAFLPV